MAITPTTSRGRATRSEILTAARAVFERTSYFDVRVADIAAEAGMSHGSVYTYFTSKDDVLHALIDELVEYSFDASSAPIDRDAPPLVQLEATIAQFLAAFEARAGMQRVLEQVITLNDDFLAKRLKIRNRFNDRIEASIRAWQAREGGDPELDAAYAAVALGGMIEDVARARFILGAPLDVTIAIRTLARIWGKAVGIPLHRVKS